MEERRSIDRVKYGEKCAVVDVETGESLYMLADNVSPLGMGLHMDADGPDLLGKDIIVVAQTIIMYAIVNRQVKEEDGSYTIGIGAKRFTPEVLQYLMESIAPVNQ